MIAPITAVVLRRSRRRPWAKGDSAGTAGVFQLTSAAESSTPGTLPPLMGRAITGRDSPSIWRSGIADPGVEERVGQVDDQVDHDERKRGDEREALHLLVVARDDRVDAEGAEPRHREKRLDDDGAADQKADLQA